MISRNISAVLLMCIATLGVRVSVGAQAHSVAASSSSSAAGVKEVAYLKASNTKANDHFGNGGTLEGHGVALSGDGTTLAVGAPYESSAAKGINGNQDDHSLYSAGAVYVFIRRNNAWSQQAYIKASNPGQGYK